MQGRMGVVCGRYRSNAEGDEHTSTHTTIVELFGRMDDGRSVCVLVHGLRPTFEIAPIGRWEVEQEIPDFLVQRLNHVKALEHVVEVRGPALKWTQLGERPVWTVEVAQPFHVPSLRSLLREQSWQVYSADIPFVNRLFLDANLGMHISFDGECIDNADGSIEADDDAIHAHGGSGRYPVDVTVVCQLTQLTPCSPFAVPFRILSFDLETSIEFGTVLCAAACIEDLDQSSRQSFALTGTESQILEQLTALIRQHDPDIITGYNIDNFDLPRLAERSQVLQRGRGNEHLASLLGWGRAPVNESEVKRQRDGLLPKRQSNRAWNLAGRVVMDTWWQARQALNPRRETLSFVAKLLFPNDIDKHKMDIDASQMDAEWAKRPEEVLAYCQRDAELPLDILQAIQVIRRKEAVGAVARVPFDTAANGSTSQLIDSLVIRLADQLNVAVPLTGSADAKEEQIAGGYVHDVEAGLHPWIAVLDFKSMYPSIMIGHNICYTTRIDASEKTATKNLKVHRSPTDVLFIHQEHRKGMIPTLLEDLMSQRDEHKSALKKAKQIGDERAVGFHDAMQYAVKILMNSFYGVFASDFYRFTHRDLGSSITAWARQNIKSIISAVEAEGHGVVYSDTDSIFVRSPVATDAPRIITEQDRMNAEQGDERAAQDVKAYEEAVAQMVAFGQGLAKQYSKDSAVLEFERGLSVFFSHGAKKRYIGQVAWPNEEMLVRGYETQRTDSFPFLTTSMRQVFHYALADQRDALIEYAIAQVAILKKEQVPTQEVVLAKSCKGRIVRNPVQSVEDVDFSKDYTNPDSMAQVRVAKQRIERGLGFTSGMKVSFIVVDAKKRPMEVEAWLDLDDEQATAKYDGHFYAERLAAALGRITEAYDWDAQQLMDGSRQTSLFSF